jgi:hypothetical protein
MSVYTSVPASGSASAVLLLLFKLMFIDVVGDRKRAMDTRVILNAPPSQSCPRVLRTLPKIER